MAHTISFTSSRAGAQHAMKSFNQKCGFIISLLLFIILKSTNFNIKITSWYLTEVTVTVKTSFYIERSVCRKRLQVRAVCSCHLQSISSLWDTVQELHSHFRSLSPGSWDVFAPLWRVFIMLPSGKGLMKFNEPHEKQNKIVSNHDNFSLY